MTEFCNFYKNGNINYNNVNLITGENVGIFSDASNSEVINHNDVYVDKNTNKFYHKFSFGTKFSYLEWKKAKDNNWEWFKSDINSSNLQCINKLHIDCTTSKNPELIDKIKMKTEIMTTSFAIMRKYNLSVEDSKIIADIISKSIDEFIE